ncbi:MAG TPA: metal-dependent transcriptional regulator [Gemmataceae bacterium]|jgi:DtxR family Mn-dependent transcriptional regulator|nr:metal-dependent transcriptional regulator [Gemmataceae bacterium]
MKELTSAVQDYLKAIHLLGGSERMVSPVEIAARLRVRAPSVTGMLKRLAEKGWITYETRRGAQLTEQGISQARRVIRRHRLVELFLTKVLGLDWSEVDAEAERLEHAISPRLEAAIAAHLGEPVEDPHGHPIPSAAGDLHKRDLKPLNEFEVGQHVIIREVQDEDPARLKRWRTLGLVPGVTVRFVDIQPLDDLFQLHVAGETVQVGSEGLRGLRGEAIGHA